MIFSLEIVKKMIDKVKKLENLDGVRNDIMKIEDIDIKDFPSNYIKKLE